MSHGEGLAAVAAAVIGVVVFNVAPAFAQAISDGGTTVTITPGHANCTVPLPSRNCFQANGAGSVLDANGIAVQGTNAKVGASAFDGGTIILNGGATFTGGGLGASDGSTKGTIIGSNITLHGIGNTDGGMFSGVDSSITLSGTTSFDGTFNNAINADRGTVTINGSIQATGNYLIGFGVARNGGQININQGGTIRMTNSDQGSVYVPIFRAFSSGTVNLNGGVAGLTVHGDYNLPLGANLLDVIDNGTINAVNSKFDGANTAGALYGIASWVSIVGAASSVSLDNSTITLNSAGSGIRVFGAPLTVTLINNSAITAFGNGANDSLAIITNGDNAIGSTPAEASLTLNATNSSLSGNVLVEAPGSVGPNTFAANLGGTTRWDGNLTNGAGSTADVTLTGSAQWTGAATNATNIGVGSGTTWSVTGDSTVSGTLTNGGVVAFASGGPFKTLTTTNYVGNGGTLGINTALGTDSSPTDQLIINGGTATGTTSVGVTNRGGVGAQTTGLGIPIIVTQAGGTTAAGAFSLSGRVAAGPFEYLLFQDQNNWYLRSHGGPDTITGPGPEIGGGDSDGDGVPDRGPGPAIPLYRPETATYGLFPALARSLAQTTIGSFHDRNGDQNLVGGSKRERIWGRMFGEHVEQSHGGHVTPSFEGYAAGFQAGADAYETHWDNGLRGRAGVFVGWAEAHGDIRGFVLGDLQGSAGDAQLEATSMGAYGTLLGPGGWYLDSILMTSFYSGSGSSTGIGVNADAWSLLGSLEAGIPFRLGGGFTLEPQAQLVYQHLAFDGTADPFSTVRFNTPDAVSGRIGLRLQGAFAGGQVRPYLKASLWQDWLDKDSVIYADTHRLDTEHGGTAVEVGGGLVAELMPGVGLWGVVDYTTDIAGDTERETLRGNAGVRITW